VTSAFCAPHPAPAHLCLDTILNLLLSWGLPLVSEALNSGPSKTGFGLSIARPEAIIAT